MKEVATLYRGLQLAVYIHNQYPGQLEVTIGENGASVRMGTVWEEVARYKLAGEHQVRALIDGISPLANLAIRPHPNDERFYVGTTPRIGIQITIPTEKLAEFENLVKKLV